VLTKEGHLKLLDFGSATFVNENESDKVGSSNRPVAHTFVGTAEYVAPEMLFESKVSFSADVWALAAIL